MTSYQTSMRRGHVASTLILRHFDVVCLLGQIKKKKQFCQWRPVVCMKHFAYTSNEPQHEKTYRLSDINVRRRLKSASAFAQSSHSLRCPHDETMHPYISKMTPSEDSDQTARMRRLIWIFAELTCPEVCFLGVHAPGLVFWRIDSNNLT